MTSPPPLSVLLAHPRGFCAGVVRAIAIVEQALAQYGAPIYVRHAIVHNPSVVQALEQKGAVFVESLSAIPKGARVIFSAHGIAPALREEAEQRGLISLDATCPLVTKVHKEAQRFHKMGKHILLIGHLEHPEIKGTMGQVPPSAISLISTKQEAESVAPPHTSLALLTQTTLSVDDTAEIAAVLQARFGTLATPPKQDICYATTNRQQAVKAIAPQCDMLVVLGGKNSSNSQRLVETARANGCANALLVSAPESFDYALLDEAKCLGLSAGASTPESQLNDFLERLQQHRSCEISEQSIGTEQVHFPLPAALSEPA